MPMRKLSKFSECIKWFFQQSEIEERIILVQRINLEMLKA